MHFAIGSSVMLGTGIENYEWIMDN